MFCIDVVQLVAGIRSNMLASIANKLLSVVLGGPPSWCPILTVCVALFCIAPAVLFLAVCGSCDDCSRGLQSVSMCLPAPLMPFVDVMLPRLALAGCVCIVFSPC